MRALLWLPLLAMTAACWQPRYFAPRENLNGTGPDGDAAAFYRVVGDALVGAPAAGEESGASQPLGGARGELRLWSSGARARFTDDDEEVVDLHVGFELENNGDGPLEIDVAAVQLEELYIDGFLQEPLAPERVTGSGYAGPGASARLDLTFRPATTYPADIDGFAVRFQVRDGDGNEVGQLTPFGPASRRSRRYYGTVGDPYWGWGPGWGAGWGAWGYGWGWGWGAGYRRCW